MRRTVEKIYPKLERYVVLIGPSIKISEMARDYSDWLYEKDIADARAERIKGPGVVGAILGGIGCIVNGFIALVMAIWMCFPPCLVCHIYISTYKVAVSAGSVCLEVADVQAAEI